MPIREHRDGRIKHFSLQPEKRQVHLEGFCFDEEQLLALTVAAEAARTALSGTPLEAPLQRAFAQLLDRLAPEAYTFEVEEQPARWHFGPDTFSPFEPHVFKTLQQATNENRSVRIDYLAARTGAWTRRRLIDPLMLVRYHGAWRVIAYCHLRGALRDFALSGIQRIEPGGHFFSPPSGFDPQTYFRDRFGALAGDRLYTVRLLVEADRAPYFQRKKYHASQHLAEGPEGRLLATYRVAGLEEMRSFVQSWGVGVTVLEPPELVQRVAVEAQALANRYGTEGRPNAS